MQFLEIVPEKISKLTSWKCCPHFLQSQKINKCCVLKNYTDLTISFKNSCHSFRGAWSSRVNDRYQWLQVSFRYPKKIVAIATQGRQDWNQWVISYRLTYSMDKIHYVYYKQLGVTKVCYRSVSVNRWFSLYKEYSIPLTL